MVVIEISQGEYFIGEGLRGGVDEGNADADDDGNDDADEGNVDADEGNADDAKNNGNDDELKVTASHLSPGCH